MKTRFEIRSLAKLLFIVVAALLSVAVSAQAKGSATRSFSPASYIAGSPFTVIVTTNTPAVSVAQGAEEHVVLPADWIISNINNGGKATTDTSTPPKTTIAWIVFSGGNQTYTYTITPPASATSALAFDGVVNFGDNDGDDAEGNVFIGGSLSIVKGTPAPTTKGSATRALPSTYTPGTGLTVTITTAPNGDATQTVADAPPTGWTVTNISNGGSFASGKVSWSIGNGTAQTLTYTATPPSSDSGTKTWGASTYTGDGAANTIGGANSIAQASVPTTKGSATRSLPSTYTPGIGLTVTITTAPNGDATQTISDALPAGWAVSNISGGGSFGSGQVTWNFANGTAQTLTYTATPPSSDSGTKTWGASTYTGDGAAKTIGGASSIAQAAVPTTKGSATRALPSTYTPGTGLTVTITTAPNGDATQGVVDVPPAGWTATNISNGGSFASGKVTWGIGNGTAQNLTYTATPPSSDSGTKTWGASTYTGDGTAKTIGGASSIAQASVPTTKGSATRVLPANYTPGTGLTVTITTSPNGDGSQTVEDYPPAGWSVTNISNGGNYFSGPGKVSWSFGNGTAQTLTYTATPPSSETGTKTWGANSTYTGDGAATSILGAGSLAQAAAASETGRIFVTNGLANSVSSHDVASGSTVSAQFIKEGLTNPYGIAVAGPNLLVTNTGSNTVSAYDLASGKLIDASFINTGVGSTPRGIAVSGSDIFVANFGLSAVARYNSAGGLVSASFIGGTLNNPIALAVSGGSIFVAYSNGTIGKYNADTGVGTQIISGLNNITGIAVSAGDLFVARADSPNGVAQYSTNGGSPKNAAFITSSVSPLAIAAYGGVLFVAYSNGTIGEYDVSTGQAVNSMLVSGLSGPYGIVVVPTASVVGADPTPEPVAKPVLTLTGKKKVKTPKANLAIKGKATGTVTSVTYRIGNKGAYKKATGTIAWTVKAKKLKPGRNIITIIGHGPGGDSAPVKVTVIRQAAPAPVKAATVRKEIP